MSLPNFLANPDPEVYRTGKYVVLDFETTNIEKGTALNPNNRLVLACWRTSDGQSKYKFGGELDMGDLLEAINQADFIVAHNAKFELQWLERCGYDVASKPVYDTFVAEWVLAGNRHWRLYLDICLERHGIPHRKDAVVSRLIESGVCPSDIPRSLLLRYCKQDVRVTEMLMEAQLADMEDTRLLPVVYTRCLATPVLADIEWQGLHLDPVRVEEVYNETLSEYTSVMAELDKITGGINPRSPYDVAHFVYGQLGFKEKCDKKGTPIRNQPNKQFPDGMPKTDEATLLSLRVTTPEQERFIELKKRVAQLASDLDKNLSMFLGACRENDGMIYAQLNQGRAVTHRLASSGRRTQYEMFDKPKGCQFQNLPRKFKPLFSARKDDWLIGETDGSQLEFRVAGHLGHDSTIIKEVRDNYDVHSYTKQVISEAGNHDISRTEAKAHTFKPLYGGRSGTAAEVAYYEAFGEKYSELSATQEHWCAEVLDTKRLETEWGFIFHWPEARLSGWKGDYLNVRTKVMNAPIQSFATADIIPIALVYFWHRCRDTDILIVNTVHDSVEAEFPADSRELFEELSVQCFTHDVYFYLKEVYNVEFSVPLGVGVKVGTHWGEGEEVSHQVEVPYEDMEESTSHCA